MNLTRRTALQGMAGMACVPWHTLLAAGAPEAGTFRMSMQAWIGYALWYVARDKGIFDKHGLRKVEFVNYAEDSSNLAIVASGSVEASSLGTQGVIQQMQQDPTLRVVMIEDASTTADCLIAPKAIRSLAQLEGKSVAFEVSSTSHLLIADALTKAGMSLSSIKAVNVPAAQAAAALIAGRVDAAVTYEPYVSAALQARPNFQRLYTAAQSPGLISDCLLVTRKALATRPGQIAAMLRSWGDALQEYQRDPQGCQRIMAKGIGAQFADLASTFAGVQFYSLAESRTLMAGAFPTQVLPTLSSLCLTLGLTRKPIDAGKVIDLAPLDAG